MPGAETPAERYDVLMSLLELVKDYERHTTIYEQLFMNAHYIILDAMAWICNAASDDDDAERMAKLSRVRAAVNDLAECEAKMLLQQKL